MYKAKVAEQTFEFEFSDEKSLEGTVNGETFKMNIAQQGNFHHVIHKHGSYKVSIVSPYIGSLLVSPVAVLAVVYGIVM